MKYLNKLGMMLVAGGMLAAASCSDFSDYNTAPVDDNFKADQTLWENISKSDNLQNFAKLLKKAGFDTNLNTPRFYTVWAPLDGTYDADKYLNEDSATILKEFVKQHIAEYNHPVSGNVDETVLTLNQKSHRFTNVAFGESAIKSANIPSINGTLHTLEGQDTFYPSIYERIEKMDSCAFRDYITRYDYLQIDESNSILGPIVNGEQTYQHTEYITKNDVISNVIHAQLENEDSVYTMLAPTDAAWNAAYARINPDFKYLAKTTYVDLEKVTGTTAASSIAATVNATNVTLADPDYFKDSLTTYNMVKNLVFSHGYPRNLKLTDPAATELDTLFSSSRTYLPSAKLVNDYTAGEIQRMSNGYLRTMDSICFAPWDTYEPALSTIEALRGLKCTPAITSVEIKSLIKSRNQYVMANYPDSVMRDSLFENVPVWFYNDMLNPEKENFRYSYSSKITTTSAQPELNFGMKDVLSTTYHIYVVLVPEQMDAPTLSLKPYYLNFYLLYTDASNAQKKKELKLSENADESWGPKAVTEKIGSKNVTSVVTKPGYVNVVDLGEFTFPICYYGLDAYPSILMSHTQSYTTAAKRAAYEQSMRVAGVYFIPAEYDQHLDKRLIKDIK